MYSEEFLDTIRTRLDQAPSVEAPSGDRLAAVLLLLMDGPEGEQEPSVVFTERTQEMSRHPGEVSFPGGIEHEEDFLLADTALRELKEELGIESAEVSVL